ncbi:PREDICTED: uncharacterized protein LOC106106636 isoform X1 [Papilio polytes]|uniref:uncharacterized protein LOC106106636 isoform X1 n=1 Tax=Papilio polytes TaxID=76194 RepID=UPI000675D874|nr:PREDICTED: uncharacterized protein LOC106106636 isoform X1 [Papilio polytes]
MDKTNSNASKCSSKSWSHNRTTDAEIIEKKGSQKGKGNAAKPPCPYCKSWLSSTSDIQQGRIDKTSSHGTPRSPGNTDLSNLKIEAPSAVCSPHLKYGIFNQKKITVNPRSVERPKSPMKQRFSSADMDNKDTVSEPGSPFFSIRALSEQDRDKFTPLQAKGGDMAARLLPAKP